MHKLASLLLTAALVAGSPPSLQARQDYCGTDIYGIAWYCTEVGTECCNGSLQGTCIPAGYTCCDTGMYCAPDEDCVIEISTNTQYCVGANDSSESHTADSDSAESTAPSSSDDEDSSSTSSSSSSDDDQEDDATRGGVSGAGMAIVGLVVVGMALL